MVQISFLGAAGEVTGSNFLIDAGRSQYLVDLGLFQGAESLQEENFQPLDFDPSAISAVIVTHAHLDHIGRLPLLVKDGFSAPIYATDATLDLARLSMTDACDLMEGHQHQEIKEMMYQRSDLNKIFSYFKAVEYHQKISLGNGDSFTLYNAGHILGSSSVLLEVDGKKLVFSGDLGNGHDCLLPAPEPPEQADVVVMEGTYGGRERADRPDRQEVLLQAVNWVIKNCGVLLIPAFAMERSQELLYLLHDLYNRHPSFKVPVFLDSPLAIEALEVYEQHIDELSRQAQNINRTNPDIFSFRNLVMALTVEESKTINEQPPPKIIIAGSGMMEGGRISYHLYRYLPSDKTLLLIIGYQAQGTLGRFIQGQPKEVKINGRTIPIRAKIESYGVFSSHADHNELVEWAKSIKISKGGKVFVTHSGLKESMALAKSLRNTLDDVEVFIPDHPQKVRL